MKYLPLSDTEYSEYAIALLVPNIQKDMIIQAYCHSGLEKDDVLVLDLHYPLEKKKPNKADMTAYITEMLVPTFIEMKTKYILCADADYFKTLTKAQKVEANLGYVMDCVFGDFKVIYIPNYRAIFYDPDKIKAKISQAINALVSHATGNYQKPGNEIIKFEEYPQTDEEIEAWLMKLLNMDVPLAIDIEAFNLKHHTAGIGTICFAWSKHEGIAFPVDYVLIEEATEAPFGLNQRNEHRRALLKQFFILLGQKAMYHSIAFDVYVLVYQLFMKDILDTEGLLEGLEIMLKNWDCTKIITYLATNSCAGNKLGLKDQAQEFAGNYAMEEIKDITRIPLNKLLRYNLVDGLSTWFTYEKHYPTMIADDQNDIYINLLQPAIKDIVQMQLTGLPIKMERVKEVKALLETDENDAIQRMQSNPIIQQYNYRLNEKLVAKKNAEYKKKRITLEDVNEQFNPNSGPQLQDLLFEVLGLPVLGLTDSKQPSTDGDTIEALVNHTSDKNTKAFLEALIDYKAVNKLTTSFIPAFENAAEGPDGWHYLFGNFNIGGTLSGRLSSSDPNLQNLPSSKSKGRMKLYVKWIKSCFVAPPGWLFCGLDFDSLEDKISAVTTKDPNKIKVYTDGYDGHCLRAYAYFGDRMSGIDSNSVVSINSIAKSYKDLRQDSKIPTFALTYMGTYITLMKNCGLTEAAARNIENQYHKLYHVSDEWVAGKLDEAGKKGYVTAAFGLRVRTPLLYQVIRGNSKTPYEAEAEGRTAGNALGQSWCLLNTRAGIEFNAVVRSSRYKYDIRPCAQIHDAQYHLIRDDLSVLTFANKHIVKAVQWQEHPDIAHDQVKMSGKLGIFYPDWGSEITIPNGASEQQILALIDDHMLQTSSS